MVTTAESDSPELLEAVSQLPDEQLERLLCQVAARRKNSPHSDSRESELISKLTQGPPEGTWEQYDALHRKKEAGQLSFKDEKETVRVVAAIENYTAQKVRWLAELAGLRDQTVEEVMESLDLLPEHG